MQGATVEKGPRLNMSGIRGLIPIVRDILPGHPLISIRDKAAVTAVVTQDLSTKRLEDIYSLLFLTSNRHNISPLHHQVVKGRQIVVTERADLHLLWHYERVFVKPIPKYLLCSEFWDTHVPHNGRELSKTTELHLEASGFLRTYANLIRHESDYELAQKLKLIPAEIGWEPWCRFIVDYAHLRDWQVSLRYHYGEIRLTRLNFWYSVRYCGDPYFEVCYNYVTYFGRFGPPMLFILASVTVLLEALQTITSIYPEGQYRAFAEVFSPFCMVLAMCGISLFPGLYLFFQIQELYYMVFQYRKPLK